MATLGIWLGPTLAVIAAAVGTRWLGWFQPKSKRRLALRRIAARLAYEDSKGYDYKYERSLEHYLGGSEWDEEWGKSDTRAEDLLRLTRRSPQVVAAQEGLSARAKCRGPHAVDEAGPLVPADDQDRAVGVLGVADGDDVREVAGDLDAITASVAAVAGLAPARLYLVFHCSAASRMRVRDSSRGSASPRTRSKTSVA
jgi:hypothetical protein